MERIDFIQKPQPVWYTKKGSFKIFIYIILAIIICIYVYGSIKANTSIKLIEEFIGDNHIISIGDDALTRTVRNKLNDIVVSEDDIFSAEPKSGDILIFGEDIILGTLNDVDTFTDRLLVLLKRDVTIIISSTKTNPYVITRRLIGKGLDFERGTKHYVKLTFDEDVRISMISDYNMKLPWFEEADLLSKILIEQE